MNLNILTSYKKCVLQILSCLLSDIDECSAGTDSCHQEAMCMDTDGSYTCTCSNGYTGNGEICNGRRVCVR